MFQQTVKPDCSLHQHLPEVQHPDPLTIKRDGCEIEQLIDRGLYILSIEEKSVLCGAPHGIVH
jgi:hypothetical protein